MYYTFDIFDKCLIIEVKNIADKRPGPKFTGTVFLYLKCPEISVRRSHN